VRVRRLSLDIARSHVSHGEKVQGYLGYKKPEVKNRARIQALYFLDLVPEG
jgi:uncharacterized protein YdbL (DUF1318 family)